MSIFKNPMFVDEFAFRTKLNYLHLEKDRLDKINDSECYKNVCQEIKRLEAEGCKYNYFVAGQYEVTQLINSITGLLVFPQQEYFEYVYRTRDFSSLPLLQQYVNNTKHSQQQYEYKNTYLKHENNQLILDSCEVDFEHPNKNDFKVVNQFTIIDRKNKRPDVLIFINGIQ